MSYISFSFAVLVIAALILYYTSPVKVRWLTLLEASLVFYALSGKWAIILVLVTATITFFLGKVISATANSELEDTKLKKRCKALTVLSIVLILLPWILIKLSGIEIISHIIGKQVAVLGISFYTLELVAYIVAIYKKNITAEENYLHFLTYALFFPKVMQGPICSYKELAPKLIKGNTFDSETFTSGFVDILWGAFLKFMIADKCSLIVNPVFDNFIVYDGLNLILALALFLIVLYTDFLACVMICKGVSEMFGIDLFMNFNRPLLATSFKEFWKRWHISLSDWLSRYIYIPLGGSRKGQARRLVNLMITFAFSAFWHGTGSGFLMWGLLQAIFRMGEEITKILPQNKKAAGNESKDKLLKSAFMRFLGRFKVCFLYGFSLIFFKLPTAKEGFSYIKSMFNFTGLINVKAIGLIRESMGYKEFIILLLAILIMFIKEYTNEAGISFKTILLKKPFAVRLIFYVAFIMIIVNFGTYGYGFKAADFIYGGF